MSALGQKRTLKDVQSMSALPPKADIDQQGRDVRLCQKRTFKGCWDMIDGMPGKVLNLVEHHHD